MLKWEYLARRSEFCHQPGNPDFTHNPLPCVVLIDIFAFNVLVFSLSFPVGIFKRICLTFQWIPVGYFRSFLFSGLLAAPLLFPAQKLIPYRSCDYQWFLLICLYFRGQRDTFSPGFVGKLVVFRFVTQLLSGCLFVVVVGRDSMSSKHYSATIISTFLHPCSLWVSDWRGRSTLGKLFLRWKEKSKRANLKPQYA